MIGSAQRDLSLAAGHLLATAAALAVLALDKAVAAAREIAPHAAQC